MVITSERTTHDKTTKALLRLNDELTRENSKLKSQLAIEKNQNKILKRKHALVMKAGQNGNTHQERKNLQIMRNSLEEEFKHKFNIRKELLVQQMNEMISCLKNDHKQEIRNMKLKSMNFQRKLRDQINSYHTISSEDDLKNRKRRNERLYLPSSCKNTAKKCKLEEQTNSNEKGESEWYNNVKIQVPSVVVTSTEIEMTEEASGKESSPAEELLEIINTIPNNITCHENTKHSENEAYDVLLKEHQKLQRLYQFVVSSTTKPETDDVPSVPPKPPEPQEVEQCHLTTSKEEEEEAYLSKEELYKSMSRATVDQNVIKTAWLGSRKYSLFNSIDEAIEEELDEEGGLDVEDELKGRLKSAEERLEAALEELTEMRYRNKELKEELRVSKHAVDEMRERMEEDDFSILEELVSQLPLCIDAGVQTDPDNDKATQEAPSSVNIEKKDEETKESVLETVTWLIPLLWNYITNEMARPQTKESIQLQNPFLYDEMIDCNKISTKEEDKKEITAVEKFIQCESSEINDLDFRRILNPNVVQTKEIRHHKCRRKRNFISNNVPSPFVVYAYTQNHPLEKRLKIATSGFNCPSLPSQPRRFPYSIYYNIRNITLNLTSNLPSCKLLSSETNQLFKMPFLLANLHSKPPSRKDVGCETTDLMEVSDENMQQIADLLQERVDDLEAQKNALKLVNLTLEDERCKLQIDANDTRIEMNKLREQLNHSINVEKTLSDQLVCQQESYRQVKEKLERQINRCNSLEQKVRSLKDKCESLEEQIMDLVNTRDSLRGKIDHVTEMLPVAAMWGFFNAVFHPRYKSMGMTGFEHYEFDKKFDGGSQKVQNIGSTHPLVLAVENRLINYLESKLNERAMDDNMPESLTLREKVEDDSIMCESQNSESSDQDSGFMMGSLSSLSDSSHLAYNRGNPQDELKNQLSMRDKQIHELQESNHSYQDRIDELEYQVKKLEVQRNELVMERKKLVTDHESQKETISNDYEFHYEELLRERDRYKSRACDLQEANCNLRQDISGAILTLTSEVLDEINPEHGEGENETLAECLSAVLHKFHEHKKAEIYLNQRVLELEKKEAAYNETIDQADKIMADIETSYTEKISRLTSRLNEFESRSVNEDLIHKLKYVEEQHEILLRRHGELEDEIRHRNQIIFNLRSDISRYEEELNHTHNITEENKRLLAELNDVRNQHIDLVRTLHNMKDRIEELRASENRLKSQLEHVEANWSQEVIRIRREVEESDSQKRSVYDQLESQSLELKEAQQQILKQNQTIAVLRQEVHSRSRDIESSEAEYRSEILRLRKQVKVSNEQLSELDTANLELEEIIKLKQDQISDLKSYYESKNKEIEEIKASLQPPHKDDKVEEASSDNALDSCPELARQASEPDEQVEVKVTTPIAEVNIVPESLEARETLPVETVEVSPIPISPNDNKISLELVEVRRHIEDLTNKLEVSEKEGELLESNLELKEKELQAALNEVARVNNLLEYFQFRNAKNLAEIEGLKGVYEKDLSEIKRVLRLKDVLIQILASRITQLSDNVFIENIINDVNAVCEPHDESIPHYDVTKLLNMLTSRKRSPPSPSSIDELPLEEDSFEEPQSITVPKPSSKLNHSNSFAANSTRQSNLPLQRASSNPFNESIRRIPRPINLSDGVKPTRNDKSRLSPTNKKNELSPPKEFQKYTGTKDSGNNKSRPNIEKELCPPKEFQILRSVAANSILLSWVRGEDDRITGYRIVVDDNKVQSVRSSSRNKALVPSLNLNKKIKFTLYAVGENSIRSSEVITYYEPKI